MTARNFFVGIQIRQVLPLSRMAALVKEIGKVLRPIIFGAWVLGLAFIVAGIWLVWMGATGTTKFSFFGQEFESTNVGIAALFLGAATLVLLIRRVLKTLDSTVASQAAIGPIERKLRSWRYKS
jgi:DMSO/TMAO reductase YedYZ heme-binding membrane subunit